MKLTKPSTLSTTSSLLVVLFALALFGSTALADTQQEEAGNTITLHVFGSSSAWWLGLKPQNDNGLTAKVELKENGASSAWIALAPNPGWGYFTLSSTSGRGFILPLTIRLTSSSGAQISVQMTTIVPDSVIDTNTQYGAPSVLPTTAPTTRPTPAPPTTAPTTRPTTAPTTRPTSAPTTAPTAAPTAPPTTRPTSAPTAAPTSPPTTRPTSAPTAAPPTTRPTSAPTTPPTTKPTTRPTTAPGGDLCAIVPTSVEPVQLLVPLYVYPGAAWDQVVTAASRVKIVAIINPNSGPLSSVDSTYSNYMTKLKNAGVEMVGYVHTLYGDRDLNLVKGEIDTYASKYPYVTGIFLDEASNAANKVSYYTQVYNHIMSKAGYKHAILNPGVQPDPGYLPISTNIVIFENYASSLSSTSYSSWVKCAPNASQKAGYKYKFSGIVHTAAASSQASIINTLHNLGMGLVYVTDGAGGCCTYNTLVSYFAQEAASVQALNGA